MNAKTKKPKGAKIEGVKDLRNTIDWLRKEGDFIDTDVEVDPDLEVTAIQKHLDGSCPILFENVKGKPNNRVITNLFGDMNVINKMFGWEDDTDRTRKLAYALSHPIAPQVISSEDAPSQQHVIENPKDVNEYMVPIRHTEYEPELTVGSGNRVVTGEYFDGGTDLGYNRMNFRWGNIG
ncbi:MAG: UbiD family decarboxylase, partial [Rhodospirillales bacterium]|nr:UbiD family decarboxylase [Rhodospirillales bacterium]